MLIEIEKRTKDLTTNLWSDWALTTDVPPYTSTELVQYRAISDEVVQIEELTSNVTMDEKFEVSGDGIFDKLMETINTHISAQYKAQRLRADNVATVYVGVVPTVLQESIKFLLQRKNSSQQLKVLEAQEALYNRQNQAFDDNKYQKIFEAQLNYNGMVFQDAADPDVLDIALEKKVNDVFNKLTQNLPISPVPEV